MIIKLSEFGTVLTGREFGESVYQELLKIIKLPVELDFKNVSSLGSSFGDEVVAPLAQKQDGIIKIYNANKVIRHSLKNIADDAHIKIEIVDNS